MPSPIILPPVEKLARISSERISVVVQGPIIDEPIDGRSTTAACLQSIRQYLPKAEIILSTWEGSDTKNLGSIDRLVTSPDPGGIWNYVKRRYNNVNRMIRSTSAGLNLASREYCLKFRTDLHLTDDRICRIDATPRDKSPYRLLSAPLTTTNFYVRDPSVIPMLFHPSDMVQFGLTRDLLDFWTQPLVDPAWLIRCQGPVLSIFGRYAGFTALRLVPEQVVTLQWLAKKGIKPKQSDIFDVDFSSFKIWEQVLLENFRLIDAKRSGVVFYPRLQRKKFFTDAANFTEETFAEMGCQQSDGYVWKRWLFALYSKYIRCFFYPRYYIRFWKTYKLYRAWKNERAQ